jgi:hypothetical protein
MRLEGFRSFQPVYPIESGPPSVNPRFPIDAMVNAPYYKPENMVYFDANGNRILPEDSTGDSPVFNKFGMNFNTQNDSVNDNGTSYNGEPPPDVVPDVVNTTDDDDADPGSSGPDWMSMIMMMMLLGGGGILGGFLGKRGSGDSNGSPGITVNIDNSDDDDGGYWV